MLLEPEYYLKFSIISEWAAIFTKDLLSNFMRFSEI